jgi:hypothetical protein
MTRACRPTKSTHLPRPSPYPHHARTPHTRTAHPATHPDFLCLWGKSTQVLLRDVALEFGFEVGSSDHLRGARVSFVDPAGPAAHADIQKGDIVISIDGRNAMGLDHTQVASLLRNAVNEEKDMLVVSVALPVAHGSVPDDAGDEDRKPGDRPKPPSYVVIRNKLRSQFGDAVYNRCKRRVQNHMSELSSRYDIMGGNRPATSTDRALCYVNGQVYHAKEASKVFMAWARVKWGLEKGPSYDSATSVSHPYEFADTPEASMFELNDLDVTVVERSREVSDNIRIRETLQSILDTEDPPEECREPGKGEDGVLPMLSFNRVKMYLNRKHGHQSVERNMGYIRSKMQEREMMMVSL